MEKKKEQKQDDRYVSLKEKIFVASNEVEWMSDKIKKSFVSFNESKEEILTNLQSLKQELSEMKTEKEFFDRFVKKNSNNKNLLDAYIKIFFDKRNRQIEKYRLLVEKIQRQVSEKQKNKHKNNQNEGAIKKVHLDGLVIENQRIRKKVEKKNKILQNLKRRNSNSRVILFKRKDVLNGYCKKFDNIKRKMNTRKRIINKSKKKSIRYEFEIGKYKKEEKEFIAQLESCKNIPEVENYLNLRKELESLRFEINKIERKCEISGNGKNVYGTLLSQLSDLKKNVDEEIN